jgi:hypothetical protein
MPVPDWTKLARIWLSSPPIGEPHMFPMWLPVRSALSIFARCGSARIFVSAVIRKAWLSAEMVENFGLAITLRRALGSSTSQAAKRSRFCLRTLCPPGSR